LDFESKGFLVAMLAIFSLSEANPHPFRGDSIDRAACDSKCKSR